MEKKNKLETFGNKSFKKVQEKTFLGDQFKSFFLLIHGSVLNLGSAPAEKNLDWVGPNFAPKIVLQKKVGNTSSETEINQMGRNTHNA